MLYSLRVGPLVKYFSGYKFIVVAITRHTIGWAVIMMLMMNKSLNNISVGRVI